jgi:quercetin dioxygenase-like cupin family protein
MDSFFLPLGAFEAFDPAAPHKADVARGERLFAGLDCLEPGQARRVHTHAGADKFYLVLSGKASFSVGDATADAAAGTLVWAPAGVPHGVLEALERTVLLVAMAPPPGGG